jgi:hypothetical protein
VGAKAPTYREVVMSASCDKWMLFTELHDRLTHVLQEVNCPTDRIISDSVRDSCTYSLVEDQYDNMDRDEVKNMIKHGNRGFGNLSDLEFIEYYMNYYAEYDDDWYGESLFSKLENAMNSKIDYWIDDVLLAKG